MLERGGIGRKVDKYLAKLKELEYTYQNFNLKNHGFLLSFVAYKNPVFANGTFLKWLFIFIKIHLYMAFTMHFLKE